MLRDLVILEFVVKMTNLQKTRWLLPILVTFFMLSRNPVGAHKCDLRNMRVLVANACDNLARKLRSIDDNNFYSHLNAMVDDDSKPTSSNDDSSIYHYTILNNHGTRQEREVDFVEQPRTYTLDNERYHVKSQNGGFLKIKFSETLFRRIQSLERGTHPNFVHNIFSEVETPSKVGKFSKAHRERHHNTIEEDDSHGNQRRFKRVSPNDRRFKRDQATIISCCESPNSECEHNLCFVR